MALSPLHPPNTNSISVRQSPPPPPTPIPNNKTNTHQVRAGTRASFTAALAPWGALVLAASAPFPADNVLDLWVRGSGLMACAIYFEDSASRRASR